MIACTHKYLPQGLDFRPLAALTYEISNKRTLVFNGSFLRLC